MRDTQVDRERYKTRGMESDNTERDVVTKAEKWEGQTPRGETQE